MHEFTVAENIIDIVGTEAGKAGRSLVSGVCLEIGLLAGIEYEALDFALGVLAPGTVLEKADITVEKPEGTASCGVTGLKHSISRWFPNRIWSNNLPEIRNSGRL